MSGFTRVVAILMGAVLVVIMGSGFIVAGTVATAGVVTVSVHESGPDGLDLYVPIPAAVVEAAVSLAPVLLDAVDEGRLDRELAGLRQDLAGLLPIVEAALKSLDDMPSATLVEVESDSEYVLVRKVRGAVEVRVEEEDAQVVVSVPIRVLRAAGGFLAG